MGSLGEVYLKSKALTPGYWGRPDLIAEAFDHEGFLKTGDAGIFDQREFLHLRGRMMDLIQFRGAKVNFPRILIDVIHTAFVSIGNRVTRKSIWWGQQ